MASHFSTIGMPVDSPEDLQRLVERADGDTEDYPCAEGRYLRWASPCGAELWIQVDWREEIVGATPHFAGESSVEVGLTARVVEDGFEGRFHGWAAPSGEDFEGGAYPFLFDAPDYRLQDQILTPAKVRVQIAAFAHDATLYPSVERYRASQEGDGLRYSDQCFIPSGLSSGGDDEAGDPEAIAFLAGHVLQAEPKRNRLTGRDYHWLLVETYGGIYDVVLDPEFAPEAPVVGGVVCGTFWLSGKILDSIATGGSN